MIAEQSTVRGSTEHGGGELYCLIAFYSGGNMAEKVCGCDSVLPDEFEISIKEGNLGCTSLTENNVVNDRSNILI